MDKIFQSISSHYEVIRLSMEFNVVTEIHCVVIFRFTTKILSFFTSRVRNPEPKQPHLFNKCLSISITTSSINQILITVDEGVRMLRIDIVYEFNFCVVLFL